MDMQVIVGIGLFIAIAIPVAISLIKDRKTDVKSSTKKVIKKTH